MSGGALLRLHTIFSLPLSLTLSVFESYWGKLVGGGWRKRLKRENFETENKTELETNLASNARTHKFVM